MYLPAESTDLHLWAETCGESTCRRGGRTVSGGNGTESPFPQRQTAGGGKERDGGVNVAILYVVATPIGNLQDLSSRGTETLRNADLIIAEDTRVTMKLCQVFGLKTPLVSCHRHSEDSKAPGLARKILEEDLAAALVTDAGTPCISDPGNEVVRACADAGIPVIPIPGCSAGIAAVSISGYDAKEFAFYGFLPREKKDIRAKLETIAQGPKVAVLHESPFRITELTAIIAETLPGVKMTVCCDLTKLHEKTLRGTPAEVLKALKANEKTEKGEYCVVLDLHDTNPQKEEPAAAEWPTEARIVEEMKQGATLREAQERLIARGEKKNAVKQAALTLKKLFE